MIKLPLNSSDTARADATNTQGTLKANNDEVQPRIPESPALKFDALGEFIKAKFVRNACAFPVSESGGQFWSDCSGNTYASDLCHPSTVTGATERLLEPITSICGAQALRGNLAAEGIRKRTCRTR